MKMHSRQSIFALALLTVSPAWAQVGPGNPSVRITLGQSRLPMIFPSSGSMANNGALTMTTALDSAYPNAYIYMPAGAIVVAGAAGWYYATCASTTVCTLFNNVYTSGKPTIPASPTAFATTGPGAYTQTTGSFITAWTFTIPGNTLGIYDEVQVHGLFAYPNSAGVKSFQLSYGAYIPGTAAPSTTVAQPFYSGFANSASLSRQTPIATTALGLSTASTNPAFGAINSATDQSLSISVKLAAATDYSIIETAIAELIKAAN